MSHSSRQHTGRASSCCTALQQLLDHTTRVHGPPGSLAQGHADHSLTASPFALADQHHVDPRHPAIARAAHTLWAWIGGDAGLLAARRRDAQSSESSDLRRAPRPLVHHGLVARRPTLPPRCRAAIAPSMASYSGCRAITRTCWRDRVASGWRCIRVGGLAPCRKGRRADPRAKRNLLCAGDALLLFMARRRVRRQPAKSCATQSSSPGSPLKHCGLRPGSHR